MKGRCVIGSFARIMRERNVSMEVKRGRFKAHYFPSKTDVWIRDLDMK